MIISSQKLAKKLAKKEKQMMRECKKDLKDYITYNLIDRNNTYGRSKILIDLDAFRHDACCLLPLKNVIEIFKTDTIPELKKKGYEIEPSKAADDMFYISWKIY